MTTDPSPMRHRSLVPLVAAGLVLVVVYSVAGTWSVDQSFGGYDADGGWIDLAGDPTRTAPVTVDVTGHPAPWVHLVTIAILAAGALWASRGDGLQARRRTGVGITAAAAFVVAIVLVFTVWQSRIVEDAFARGNAHPHLLGNVHVVRGTMPPG